MIVKDITELIGNTPLLEVSPQVHGLKNINLYAKLELFNPFGSVKDKTAWNMLRHDLAEIERNSQTVIEASSGNTAKAIQVICSMRGIPVKVVTNRVRIREVKQILQLLGTEIVELPGQSQCVDPTDPNDPLFVVERMLAAEPGKYYHTSQYTNARNLEAHYEMTGREIADDLSKVDFFFGGLGTTGSTRGTGEFLKALHPWLQNVGIIASKGGLIPGIRNSDEMYEVGLFDRSFYDAIVEVSMDDSIDATLSLIRNCGLLSGPTGGACFAGALKYLHKLDNSFTERQNAVFLVCDRIEWYLSYMQKYRPKLFGLNGRKNVFSSISVEAEQDAREMNVDDAEQWLVENQASLVIDLRGSLAFKASHINRSINIPADMLEEICEWGLPISRDQKILFVCPIGDQSRKFVAHFSAHNIDCASLKGGFIAWRDAKKEVLRQTSGNAAAKELVGVGNG